MKQHILVISQYFYPEQFRINDICKEWIKRGYQVTVVTGIPNYPQGRFFSGYGLNQKRKEKYEGINIIRLPIVSRGNNTVRMILNYLSFVISGFLWKLFTKIRADKVFIFEVSPMTQALVGIWYAKRRKIPCYLYVQDLWPENVEIVTGVHNKLIIAPIDRMVDYIYKNCNKILATSPSFVKRIEERAAAYEDTQCKKSKVVYFPQYAEDFYQPMQKQPLKDIAEDNFFKIVFTGNIGYAQGLDILPKVAVLLQEKEISCRFYIIGEGRYRQEFESIIEAKEVTDMFRMLGKKEPEDIPKYMAYCDVAFLSFADNPLFEMTIPAKLQSYMACGMPILAVAGGETGRIVSDAGCGVVCRFNEIDALADKIVKLINSSENEICIMRENALNYCRKYFNKDKLLNELEGYFN